MTLLGKLLAPAGLALTALIALPAHAQVEGRIATVDITGTILGSTAFQTAYSEVGRTYTQQTELRRTKTQDRQNLLATFDKNGDKQVDESEQAAMQKSPDLAKLQTLEQEIQGLTNQIDGARVYAIEQIIAQYPAALRDVTTANQIKLVIAPDALLFAPPEADVTAKVITALNTKVTTVGVVPPSTWQPSREGVQIFQEIQQRLVAAAQIAQQQQAQQPAAAPVGR